MTTEQLIWPPDPHATIPYWVYTDGPTYERELQRIWYGAHWLYCCLEVELPEPGSFRTLILGERPVIAVRTLEGEIAVLENRCAHHGTKICWTRSGKLESLTCPYHQWSYDLEGQLLGVPFKRGIKGQGGLPKDFDSKQYSLRRLKTEVINGIVWASFSADTPPFREYLGEHLWPFYERIFNGRQLRVIGYNRQRINGNWKLMLENNKDSYHGALLHIFFATFGLFRPDQKNTLDLDPTGRHACITSVMTQGGPNDVAGALPGFDSTIKLQDTRLIEAVKELQGEATMGAITVFPSVILLQQVNSMQARQIVPRGPQSFDFVWTHFGFADDDPAMRERRVRHANLFGPSGFVSADDAEAIRMLQQSIAHAPEETAAVTLMGGREIGPATNMATESAIRGMYSYYRDVMQL
jgi:salicylate 5-hydroxylase large subunit